MRSTQAHIVGTKIRMPTPRVGVVSRGRLLERLDGEAWRVALVSAAAGFGKSVLAVDWIRRSPRPVAWLSVDPLDDEPTRFFAHLAAALRGTGDPALTAAADLLMRPGSDDPPPEVLTALSGGDAGALIVLEDLHHLESPPLLRFVESLVRTLTEGPRIVLLTRVDPPFPMARLRVSGELLELRERDLRFTPAEAQSLLDRLLPDLLSPTHVATLQERTEGWPAGLRIAAAALEGVADPAQAIEAFAGSHHLVVDYLMEEAVGRQDEGLQTFLMDTSLLSRFTAEGCRRITRDEEAGRHLDAVNKANLFLVSLDGSGTWFRYHHLFAELLEFRLRRLHPERVDGLHRRASEWFEEQGDVEEALRHAGGMEDRSRLLELLDANGYSILARSEYGSFSRWLARVPDPAAQPYPMFQAALAWFRSRAERAPDLDRLLAAVEAAVERPPPSYPPARLREARLHVDAFRGFVLRVTERFDEAIELAQRVLADLPPDATTIRGVVEFNLGAVYRRMGRMESARLMMERGYQSSLEAGRPYLMLASLAHLGGIAAQTEGLASARQRLEAALRFSEERGLSRVPAFAIVLHQLAQVCFLGDELQAARTHLERALEVTRGEAQSEIRANVLVLLARVAAARGDAEEAVEHLSAAEALTRAHNVEFFDTTLNVERERLATGGSAGLPSPAPFASVEDEPWSTLKEAASLLRLQRALGTGDFDEARSVARRLRAESEPLSRGVALCVALLGEAATAQIPAERHGALEEALRLAAARGYVRPLLEAGAPVRALLESSLAGPMASDVRTFLRDRVLPAFGEAPEVVAGGDAGETAGLTDREVDVLIRLAAGSSNKDIARQTFVSVNTVKTHLKRIFAKLGVSSRTGAVARARLLGLLPGTGSGDARPVP